MSLAMLPRDLHPALHEGGVGVELALLDLLGVVVGHGQGEVGVGDLAQLRVEELPVLQDPVVLHVAIGAAA